MTSRERKYVDDKDECIGESYSNISHEDQKWIEGCESFILENLTSEFLSVSWISQEFNMSESTLTRQLKRIIGLSPGKYVTELRLNLAKELLTSVNSMTVSQVSNRVGFQDAKAFSRSFKRRFGVSPSKLE